MSNTFPVSPPEVDTLLTSSSNSNPAHEYLAWKRSYTIRAFRAYKIWVHRFQDFVNKMPEDLRHTDYVAFASLIRDRYAPRCVEFALNVVHNYLRFFWEQGRLRFPLYLARVPRGIAKSYTPASEEDYRAIVQALKTDASSLRDLLIIMLLHDTGMRVGELLSLRIDDMEEDRSAVIRTEKTIRNRRVFWNLDTDDALQAYLVHRVNNGPKEPDWLFASSFTGNALTARTVERILKDALCKASVTTVLCPHSFRHAFIHRLAKLGVPDAIIAQLVGHSGPNTIAHYTKLSRPEFKDYALKQLAYTEPADTPLAA